MNGRDGMEQELNLRLDALRDAMQDERAPERVRDAVMEAYRRRRPKAAPAWWRHWRFAAAAGLAAVAAIAAVVGWWPRADQRRGPLVAEVSQPPVVQETSAPQPLPVVNSSTPPPRRTAVERPAESGGPFIPLVPDLAWMPGEGAQVLRVTMPRTALQSLGLPVDENVVFETVRADIGVGQDMVARAIRLVP
jgi:hypothetical protein